jgi:hypothetical protein
VRGHATLWHGVTNGAVISIFSVKSVRLSGSTILKPTDNSLTVCGSRFTRYWVAVEVLPPRSTPAFSTDTSTTKLQESVRRRMVVHPHLSPMLRRQIVSCDCSGRFPLLKMGSLPDKQCSLDLMPTRLLKVNVDILAPFLSRLFCWSLRPGAVPSTLKSAYITPILKNSDLNPLNTKSYRPISNFSVVSKLLEKIVSRQLVAYLTLVRILPQWTNAVRPLVDVQCGAILPSVWSSTGISPRAKSLPPIHCRFTRDCEATPAASSCLCRRHSDLLILQSVGRSDDDCTQLSNCFATFFVEKNPENQGRHQFTSRKFIRRSAAA